MNVLIANLLILSGLVYLIWQTHTQAKRLFVNHPDLLKTWQRNIHKVTGLAILIVALSSLPTTASPALSPTPILPQVRVTPEYATDLPPRSVQLETAVPEETDEIATPSSLMITNIQEAGLQIVTPTLTLTPTLQTIVTPTLRDLTATPIRISDSTVVPASVSSAYVSSVSASQSSIYISAASSSSETSARSSSLASAQSSLADSASSIPIASQSSSVASSVQTSSFAASSFSETSSAQASSVASSSSEEASSASSKSASSAAVSSQAASSSSKTKSSQEDKDDRDNKSSKSKSSKASSSHSSHPPRIVPTQPEDKNKEATNLIDPLVGIASLIASGLTAFLLKGLK